MPRDFQAGKGAIEQSASSLQGSVNRILGLIGVGVSIGAIISEMRQGISLAERQIDAEARLGAVIKGTGMAAGFTVDQLKAMASEMQSITTVGDEEIMESMAIMGTFKTVTGDTFKSAMDTVLDMSAVMGTSARGAVMQLGRALEDPVRGVTALRRTGVTFNEQQRAQIKLLVETNRLQEAQALVLGVVRGQLGDVAEAMAKTDAGKLKQARNILGDLREELGRRMIPVQIKMVELQQKYIVGLTKAIDVVSEFISENKGLATGLGLVAVALASVGASMIVASIATKIFGLTLRSALMSTGVGIALVALGALVGWLVDRFKLFDKIGPMLDSLRDKFAWLWEQIRIGARMARNVVVDTWQAIVAWATPIIEMLREKWKEFFGEMKKWVQPWIDAFVEGFMSMLNNLDVMLGSFEGLREGIIYYMEQAGLAFQAVWEQMKNFVQVKLLEIKGFFIDTWYKLSEIGVQKAMPPLARFFTWIEKKKAKMRGEPWMTTPEEEEEIIRSTQENMLRELGQERRDATAELNEALQNLERGHQEKMSSIGQKSLDLLEEWKKKMEEFPRLSEWAAEEWERAKRELAAEAEKEAKEEGGPKPKPPPGPAGGPAGGEGAEAGRFGFAEYGKMLQDMYLKTNDPQNRTARATERSAEANEDTARFLEDVDKKLGKLGLGSASYTAEEV